MIYVSTSCVKTKRISEAIELLARSGFVNIELSGGTDFYDGLEEDVFALKNKFSLNYISHNYFPPPREHFVLNLASLNNELYDKSIEYLIGAIMLSRRLQAPCFGFHAGFFLDLCVSDLGHPIAKDTLFDKEESVKRFCDGFKLLQNAADARLDLYIENNVLMNSGLPYQIPFMLLTFNDYVKLKQQIEFKLLLDIGHLKVSCQSLSLNFSNETKAMASSSNYFHVSENNGLLDEHAEVTEDSNIWNLTKSFITKDSIVTLEITGIDKLMRTHDILMRNLQ